MKVLSSIRFLARQGLPFRGHHEDSESFEGNLYQLLLMQAQDHPQMKSWLYRKEYISPVIVNDLCTIKEIENLLLNAANSQEIEPKSEVVLKFLENDVDDNRLKIQLLMLPSVISTAFASEIPVKNVTNVRTIANAMEQSEIYRGMLSEIDKVLKIYFAFPVTSATAERSFSYLRRIKTYLRNSMSQCRLNNLFILYVHSSKTDTLDLESVARAFVSVNSRRTHYFGRF